MRTFHEYCDIRPLMEVARFIVNEDLDPESFCSDVKEAVLSESLGDAWAGIKGAASGVFNNVRQSYRQGASANFQRRQNSAYRSRVDQAMHHLRWLQGEMHELGIPGSQMDTALSYVTAKLQSQQNKATQPGFVAPHNGAGHGDQKVRNSAAQQPQQPANTPADPATNQQPAQNQSQQGQSQNQPQQSQQGQSQNQQQQSQQGQSQNQQQPQQGQSQNQQQPQQGQPQKQTWEYVAKKKDGNQITGNMTGFSQQDVEDALSQRGYEVVSVKVNADTNNGYDPNQTANPYSTTAYNAGANV